MSKQVGMRLVIKGGIWRLRINDRLIMSFRTEDAFKKIEELRGKA